MIDAAVANFPLKMKIDSGSGVNTIAETEWHRLKDEYDAGRAILRNLRTAPDTLLLAYGNNELAVLAQFEAMIAIVGFEVDPLRTPRIETFTVCRGTKTSLMSRSTAEYFKVLKLGPLELDNVEQIKVFPSVPNYVVKFDIDQSAPGHVDMALRVPLAQQREQKEVLIKYERMGIIERVPTSENPKFVSPQFFVKKSNGSLRLVSDNKEANKALRTVNHTMPTLEGFLPDFANHDTFSLLDIKDAFLHLPLDEESSKMTTFNTPWGLYRYTRLNFGCKPSPPEWQRYMDRNFLDLPGVKIFMDDIIIFGRGHEECLQRTEAVKRRCTKLNLTLNEEKCKICQMEVTFLGMRLDKHGIHPTFSKLEALRNMRPPVKVSELRGFLGLFTFFSSFIPNFSDKTKQMRKLIRNNAPFVWTEEIQKEFDNARLSIEVSATRAHFDQDAYRTYIYTDASRDSLSAVMTQTDSKDGPHRMIMCASRQTTPAEANYGQDGLEAAAVAWIFPKWEYYTLARHITLVTDASALTYIYSNGTKNKRTLCRANTFALKVAGFDFDVEHISGKKNPADAFSRLSTSKDDAWSPVSELFEIQELYEIQAADHTWKKSIDIEDIKERTRDCSELCKVMEALDTGCWDTSVIKYKHVDNELAMRNGILVRGSRIIPPVSMRRELLDDAHLLHPGIVTMKRFLRQRAWWPGMDTAVEKLVKSCYPCLLTAQRNPPIPMQVPYAPEGPWELIAIDLHSHQPKKSDEEQSPFQNACKNHGRAKRNLLVIIDLYSRFIRVFPTERTDTEAIISLLALTFSFYGNPECIKSDNGPPFNSEGYKEFLSIRGIETCHSTPLWPQANANVERAMRTINDRLRKGAIEDADWKELMREFNQRYNEWPHSQTNTSPFTMMLRREPRLALPSITEKLIIDEQASDHELRLKMERKVKTDKKRRAEQSPLKVGDHCVMIAESADKRKISTTYADEVWRVLERNGCEVFVQSVNDITKTRRRNVNLCRIVPTGLTVQTSSLRQENDLPLARDETANEPMETDDDIADQNIHVPTAVQLQTSSVHSQPGQRHYARPTRNCGMPAKYMDAIDVQLEK